MSSNPIDNVDGEHIAGQIVMERAGSPNKTLLLLEGEDDRFVYKNFIDKAKCDFIICYSSTALIKGISIVNSKGGINGYLGIKDADFDKLNNFHESNILVTDGHDLENMICQSQALDNFVESRLLVDSKNNKGIDSNLMHAINKDIRERLFYIGGILGYIQWIVIQNFREIEIKNAELLEENLDNQCHINLESCVRYLKKKHNFLDESKYSEDEFIELTSQYPYHMCCNGHILVFLLERHLFKKITKKYLKDERKPGTLVSQNLLLAYNYEIFQKSQLFNEIRRWENQNAPFRVLR